MRTVPTDEGRFKRYVPAGYRDCDLPSGIPANRLWTATTASSLRRHPCDVFLPPAACLNPKPWLATSGVQIDPLTWEIGPRTGVASTTALSWMPKWSRHPRSGPSACHPLLGCKTAAGRHQSHCHPRLSAPPEIRDDSCWTGCPVPAATDCSGRGPATAPVVTLVLPRPAGERVPPTGRCRRGFGPPAGRFQPGLCGRTAARGGR